MADIEQKGSLKEVFSNIWWLVLLRGIVILLMGILLISRPLPTIIVLFYLLGFYWFFDGIFTVIESIRGKKGHEHWGWGVFVGIISVLAGILVFTQPYLSAVIGVTFVIYLVAIMVLISGIWSIVTGIRLRKVVSNEWSMILGGVISALFAILLMSNPLVSAMTLVWLMGLFALIGGIVLIIVAFRIKSLSK